jgi:hypothetical protein
MSTEAVSALNFNMLNMAAAPGGAGPAQAKATDVAQFQAELEQAQRTDQLNKARETETQNKVSAPSESMQWLSEGLGNLNTRANGLAVEANGSVGQGEDLKPKDMLMLTVHAHEFLFHCELTSNVANRTSDGITQLFRQQS